MVRGRVEDGWIRVVDPLPETWVEGLEVAIEPLESGLADDAPTSAHRAKI